MVKSIRSIYYIKWCIDPGAQVRFGQATFPSKENERREKKGKVSGAKYEEAIPPVRMSIFVCAGRIIPTQ